MQSNLIRYCLRLFDLTYFLLSVFWLACILPQLLVQYG